MKTILTRIQEITSNERMTIGAMERSIGASKGVLSRAISNGTDIQSKWIQIIVENYPRYSPEWLLTGKGNMLKGAIEQPPSPQQSNEKEPTQLLNQLLDTIKEQAEEIGQLKEQVRQLTIEKERLASNAHSSHAANVG